MVEQVKAWQEEVRIPTYLTGPPEKNPMFLERRVYQGSSGVVYPYPIIETISGERVDISYTAVFLENKYMKIMILPALGGRIQMAYDKIGQRHFIYYNRVIKPALVGLTGPWISGGIEFNWPQHHRPSTFEPVDFVIKGNAGGSKTVWVNEVERMTHLKGMAGFTLYPDRAYLEIEGRLYNRTPFPQTFLWWANPAVKVNDHYQSVFPPDVHAVYDHGRRDVSEFPIARGTYYKVDYSPGTDISWYRNIPVPTSFMAVASRYDFIGGYEHDCRAGLLHVADHHISPGKKQWTWGTGDFGKAWERNLTDEDGPYVELMTGVFTDNQPDFSWLQPYEEKSFVQYFIPYRDTGVVKNASRELLLGFDTSGQETEIKLFATRHLEGIRITLTAQGQQLFTDTIGIGPENPYSKKIQIPKHITPLEVKVTITDAVTGEEMLTCRDSPKKEIQVPSPAMATGSPYSLKTNEELYLAGLHLEQYRHATLLPADYYREALSRDPDDARNNNALGLWYLRRGKFEMAEPYFRKAIETLTRHNPNPSDGEPYYNLGSALLFQGRIEEAYDAFYKSIWNHAWQHAGYLNLARIAVRQRNYLHALELVGESLIRNTHSHTARHLKAVILRYLDRRKEAEQWIGKSLELDPFNFGCLYEKYVLVRDKGDGAADGSLDELQTLSRNHAHNFLEYALDYVHAGLARDASVFLKVCYEANRDGYALVPYYLGWFAYLDGDRRSAEEFVKKGAALKPDHVFPDRIEEIQILQTAIGIMPEDAFAHYYLGNLWYHKRQYVQAMECWETAAGLRQDFPTVHRNLAIAYHNKLHDRQKALASMEKAFLINRRDARVLMELDSLRKIMNRTPEERLALLEEHLELIDQRDDLYLERITLYNQLHRFTKAMDLMAARQFHPWEGGEGKVVRQFIICHVEKAKLALAEKQPVKALGLLGKLDNYPDSLGEGKLYQTQENDIHYLKGIAYEMLHDQDAAEKYFMMATTGISEPLQAFFYNDPQPDQIVYQGMAWRKLKRPDTADTIFQRLTDFGKDHIKDEINMDYFAVSWPDMRVFDEDMNMLNRIHCLYMTGLGHMGRAGGFSMEAEKGFNQVLALDSSHQGAQIHNQMMKNPAVW